MRGKRWEMRQKQSNRKHERGFTLMELMVVMVIIGILATIVAGNFVQAKLRARDAQRKNDLGQMQRTMEAYYNDYGIYPSFLSSDMAWGAIFVDPATEVTYMNQLPNDPQQPASQFLLLVSTDGIKYQLFAHLENTKDDDISTHANVTTRLCGTTSYCNYVVTSSNTTVSEVLQ